MLPIPATAISGRRAFSSSGILRLASAMISIERSTIYRVARSPDYQTASEGDGADPLDLAQYLGKSQTDVSAHHVRKRARLSAQYRRATRDAGYRAS